MVVTHDLASTLMEKMKLLDASVSSLHSLGTDAARKEKEYRVKYAKTMLSMKAEGQSVSLIEGLAKGNEEVATAKLEWDIAVSKWEAAREYTLSVKKEIDIYNDIIRREWSAPN